MDRIELFKNGEVAGVWQSDFNSLLHELMVSDRFDIAINYVGDSYCSYRNDGTCYGNAGNTPINIGFNSLLT